MVGVYYSKESLKGMFVAEITMTVVEKIVAKENVSQIGKIVRDISQLDGNITQY